MFRLFSTINPTYIIIETIVLATIICSMSVNSTGSSSTKVIRAKISRTDDFLKHWCFSLPKTFPCQVKVSQTLLIHYKENFDANSHPTIAYTRTFVDGVEEITSWYPPKIEFDPKDEHLSEVWHFYNRTFDGTKNISLHNTMDCKNPHIDWIEWSFTYEIPPVRTKEYPKFALILIILCIRYFYLIPLVIVLALTTITEYSGICNNVYLFLLSLLLISQIIRVNEKPPMNIQITIYFFSLLHIIITLYSIYAQGNRLFTGEMPVVNLLSYIVILQVISISAGGNTRQNPYTTFAMLMTLVPFIFYIVLPGNFMEMEKGLLYVRDLFQPFEFFGLLLAILSEIKMYSADRSTDQIIGTISIEQSDGEANNNNTMRTTQRNYLNVFNIIPFLIALVPLIGIKLVRMDRTTVVPEPLYELH